MSKTVTMDNSVTSAESLNNSADTIKDEISDNEEILFELDECLHSKDATLNELKEQAETLEKDIKRYTTPYNCETSLLEEDITMFRNIASKYVKKDLVDFYIDRVRKTATNTLESDQSTISALCEIISKGQDL